MSIPNRTQYVGSSSSLESDGVVPPDVIISVQYTDWNGQDHQVIDNITADPNTDATVRNSDDKGRTFPIQVQFSWYHEGDLEEVTNFFIGDIDITAKDSGGTNQFGQDVPIPGRNSATQYKISGSSDDPNKPTLVPIEGIGDNFKFTITPASNSAGTILISVPVGSAYQSSDMNNYGPPKPVSFEIKYDNLARDLEEVKPEVRIIVPRNTTEYVEAYPEDFAVGSRTPIVTQYSPPPNYPGTDENGNDIPLSRNDLHYETDTGVWSKYTGITDGWQTVFSNYFHPGLPGDPSEDDIEAIIPAARLLVFRSEKSRWLGKGTFAEDNTEHIDTDLKAKTWIDGLPDDTDSSLIYFWQQDNVIRRLRTEYSEPSAGITFVWSQDVSQFNQSKIVLTAVNHAGADIQIGQDDLSPVLPVGMSGNKYRTTLDIPDGEGVITITVNQNTVNNGPPEDTSESFNFKRTAGSIPIRRGISPTPTFICSDQVSFTETIGPDPDGNTIVGAYKTSIDKVVVGNYLYNLLQVQKKSDTDDDELYNVFDAGAVLLEIDTTQTNECRVLKVYNHVLAAPKRLIEHENKVFFFEGNHLIYQYLDTSEGADVNNPDWRDQTGELFFVDPSERDEANRIVKEAGRGWRYRLNHPIDTDSLYENRVYGILGAASAPILSDGKNIHIQAGFGDYNEIATSLVETDRYDGRPITHVGAMQWLVYGKDLNRRIEKLETNDRSAWDVLLELANVTASYIGFDNGKFFMKPRYPIKAELNGYLPGDLSLLPEEVTAQRIGSDENNISFRFTVALPAANLAIIRQLNPFRYEQRDGTSNTTGFFGRIGLRGNPPEQYLEEDNIVLTFARKNTDEDHKDYNKVRNNSSFRVRTINNDGTESAWVTFTENDLNIVADGNTIFTHEENISLKNANRNFPTSGFLLIDEEIIEYDVDSTEPNNNDIITLQPDEDDNETIERAAKESDLAQHNPGKTVYFVNHIIDTRNIETPMEDIQLEQDVDQLYNQIRISYGGDLNLVHPEDDEDSIKANGGRKLELDVPLNFHQDEWVQWLAKTYLETYKDIHYICDVDLKLSFYIKVGDTLMMRDYSPAAEIYNSLVFQVLEVNHSKSEQQTSIKIRTIN